MSFGAPKGGAKRPLSKSSLSTQGSGVFGAANNNNNRASSFRGSSRDSAASSRNAASAKSRFSNRHVEPYSITRDLMPPHQQQQHRKSGLDDDDIDPLELSLNSNSTRQAQQQQEQNAAYYAQQHEFDAIDGGAALPLQALLDRDGTIPNNTELSPESYDALAVMERLNHTRRLLESLDVERQECKRHMERGRELYLTSPRIKDMRVISKDSEERAGRRSPQQRRNAADEQDFEDDDDGSYETPKKQTGEAAAAKNNDSNSSAQNNKSVFSRLSAVAKPQQQQQPPAAKKATNTSYARSAYSTTINKNKDKAHSITPEPRPKRPSPKRGAAAASSDKKKPRDERDGNDGNRSSSSSSSSSADRHVDDDENFHIPGRFVSDAMFDPDAPVIIRTPIPENANLPDYCVTYSSPVRLPPGMLQQQLQQHPHQQRQQVLQPSVVNVNQLQQGMLLQQCPQFIYRMQDPQMMFGNNLQFTAACEWYGEE